MALDSTDLFVVQSQTDKKLYKLRLDALIAEVQAGPGINFRGSADLSSPPAASGITLPALNGDLYIVANDTPTIDPGWVMQGGETSAIQGDRVLYDGNFNDWVLVTSGTSNTGTVTGVLGSSPIESDGNAITPVISVHEARTNSIAVGSGDGKGTSGVCRRLAESGDVLAGSGTGDANAVVTADLLKQTNDDIYSLSLAGVLSVLTNDDAGNAALTISPNVGDVVIELKTAADSNYGVVQLADAADILAGTSGPDSVIDAAQLKAVSDLLPQVGTDTNQYLIWNGSNWVPTIEIDAGVYAT